MKKIVLVCFVLLLTGCSKKLFKEKWTEEKAPVYFKARFETTKGNFDIEAKREWSPKAVDRLHQLIKSDFYTDIAIFRVVPDFVAQFGIHNTKVLNEHWERFKIEDETVIESNDKMTISFARGGRKSRTTQIFINLKNNKRLDALTYSGVKGFPVVARVIAGEENAVKFYSGYAEEASEKQDSISRYGNAFLKSNYPKLDYIIKAYIIK